MRLFNTELKADHPPVEGQPKVLIIDPKTGEEPFEEVKGGFEVHPGEVTTGRVHP